MNDKHVGVELSYEDKKLIHEWFESIKNDPNVDTRRIRVREELDNLQKSKEENDLHNKK